jgi:hypothetical protein
MTTPDPITKARPRTDRLVASPYGLGSATTGARQHSQPSGKIPYQVKTDAKWGHFGPPRRGHCKLPLSLGGTPLGRREVRVAWTRSEIWRRRRGQTTTKSSSDNDS